MEEATAPHHTAALKEPLHAFLSRTLAIVGLIIALDFYGFLEELDSDARSLAIKAQLLLHEATDANLPIEANLPYTLILTDRLFETALGEKTPLDKTALNEIISRVLAHSPAVLTLDLDISPSYCPEQLKNEDCDQNHPLYDTLTSAPATTQIVLPTPFPITTAEAYDAKIKWLTRMCRNGIHFAYAGLHSLGNEIKITPTLPTLATTTFNRLNEVTSQITQPICEELLQTPSENDNTSSYFPDLLLNLEEERADFFDTHIDNQRLFPLDWRHYKPVLASTLAINRIDQPFDPAQLKQRVVFLGGSFGEADEFNTPFGATDGVYLHALAFASLNNPRGNTPAWRTPLILIAFSFFIFLATRFKQAPRSRPPMEELALLTLSSVALFIVVAIISGLTQHELPAAQLTLLIILLTETRPSEPEHIDPLRGGVAAFLASRECQLRLAFTFLGLLLLIYSSMR